MSKRFEQISSEVAWSGKLATVRVERYRHDDGEEVTREVVGHPGAVVIVPCDEQRVWLVRQPREVVGAEALLELPAGKLDVEDEPPLETAKRELAEEVGKAASEWDEVLSFFTSPGFTDERIVLFHARGLSDVEAPEADEEERIEVVAWPLERLDDAIAACEDGKSLVGLLWLARRLGIPSA